MIGYFILLFTEPSFRCVPNDNFGEIILMRKTLLFLKEIADKANVDCSLNENIIESIVTEFMPRGQKKKLLVNALDEDIRIYHLNVTTLRTLSRFEVNKQLDGLARRISESPYKPQIIPKSQKVKIINKAVAQFYVELRIFINDFSFLDVLQKLFILHESAIQNREHFKFENTPRLECFGKHGDIFSILSKENKLNVNTSLSIRCLIEHIVAEPPTGTKEFDLESFDKALAYMYNIINWGFISDDIAFKLTDIEVTYLESGRLGTSKDFSNQIIEPFYESKFSEDIEDSKDRFKKKFKFPKKEKQEEYKKIPLDDPFLEEFQINVDDLFLVAQAAINLSFNHPRSFYIGKVEDFISEVRKQVNITEENIKKCLSQFSLINRGKVENVKQFGFTNPDFYPWRYNRALSLLNKPFVLFKIKDVDYIGFSARSVYDSRGHILHSFFSGRYNAKTDKMKSFMAKINSDKGNDFNKDCIEYLEGLGNFSFIKSTVKIGPRGPLVNNEDIGDIDILLVDDANKKVLAIECKNTNTSRTPYEIHLELLNFIGKENNGWISKVDKRNTWINSNRSALDTYLKRDLESYSFEYIFLTAQVIPLPFIKDLDLKYRFVSQVEMEYNINRLVIG